MGQINTSPHPEVNYDDFKDWHGQFESLDLRVCQTILYGKATSRDVYVMSNGMPVILRICDMESKKILSNVNKVFIFLVENRKNLQRVVDSVHRDVVQSSKETQQMGDFLKSLNSGLTSMPFILKLSTNTSDIEYVDKEDSFKSVSSIGMKLINSCDWRVDAKSKELIILVGTRQTMNDRLLSTSDKEHLLLLDFVKYTFVLKDIVSILLRPGGHIDSSYAGNKLNDMFCESTGVSIDTNEAATHSSEVHLDRANRTEDTTETEQKEYTASKRFEKSVYGTMDTALLEHHRHSFRDMLKKIASEETTHVSDTEKKDRWVPEHKHSMNKLGKSKTEMKMCHVPTDGRYQELAQQIKTREETIRLRVEFDERKTEFAKVEQELKAQIENLESEIAKKEGDFELKSRQHKKTQSELKEIINRTEKCNYELKQKIQVLESKYQDATDRLPKCQTDNSYLQDRITQQELTTQRLEHEYKQINSELARLKAECDETTLTLKTTEENKEELDQMLREKVALVESVRQDRKVLHEKAESLAFKLEEEKQHSEKYANELKALKDEGYKNRAASLMEENEDLGTKIIDLEEKYSHMERQFEDECKKCDGLERDQKKTEKYLESMKAQAASWEVRCCEKNEQIAQFQSKVKLLMIELADKEKEMENICKENMTLLSKQIKEVEEINAEKEALKEALTLQENVNQEIENLLTESQKQGYLLRTECDKIKEHLKDTELECENLTRQQNEKVRSIEQNNEELRLQLESIKSEWNEKSSEVLQQTLVEKNDVIEHLTTVNADISKQLEDVKVNLQQQKEHYAETIENSKQMLHEKDNRIKSTDETNKDLLEKVTSLSNRLSQFDSIKREQNEILREKETMIEHLKAEIELCKKDCATEVTNVAQTIFDNNDVIENLTKVNADLNKQLTDAKSILEAKKFKIKEQEESLRNMQKYMHDKEEMIYSILQENDRLNQTVNDMITCQSKNLSEVKQRDKRIAELEEQLKSNGDAVWTIQKDNDDLKAGIEFLEKECHKKDSLNQKYRQEMVGMTSRLAWEMNKKISSNETHFENISIACRPLKIADEYSNLCSNIWLEAKQQLDEMQFENEVSLKFLCDILMACRQAAGDHLDYTMRELRNLLYDPVKDGSTVDRGAAAETDVNKPELRDVPQDVATVVGDHFRRQAAEVDIGSLIMRVVKILNEGKIMTEQVQKSEAITLYIEESSRLAWQMVIQRPPMTFSQIDINKPFKGEKEHPLAWGSQPSNTSVVRLYQYPTLLHGDTVMVKGKVLVS